MHGMNNCTRCDVNKSTNKNFKKLKKKVKKLKAKKVENHEETLYLEYNDQYF